MRTQSPFKKLWFVFSGFGGKNEHPNVTHSFRFIDRFKPFAKGGRARAQMTLALVDQRVQTEPCVVAALEPLDKLVKTGHDILLQSTDRKESVNGQGGPFLCKLLLIRNEMRQHALENGAPDQVSIDIRLFLSTIDRIGRLHLRLE